MKNFQRVIPVVLGGFLLSGCLLPTHFTVASWAIDGISVLFTKKSVTDHGISAIAQKDCALWRGFTEGEVCRDEDSITAIADAGDISNTGKPATTASLAGSATNDGKINAKAVYHNSILSDLAFEDKLMDKPVSWQNDIDNSKFVGVVVSDDVSADVIEIEVLNASDELFADMPMMEVSVDASKTALLYGNYLVIGSFGNWSNATRFAKQYENLGTQIVSADVNVGKVFRIIVGPYTASTRDVLEASIKQAGIEEVWGMKVSENSMALDWKQTGSAQVASIAQ